MTGLTPEKRAELRELLDAATDRPWVREWDTSDQWWTIHGQPNPSKGDERMVCPEVATLNHREDWTADVDLIVAAANALPALLDAADERDKLLTVADTLGRVNGEYAMEIHRCREALGVDEDTDPHHAAQALAAAVEHWHLACIGESIRVSELEAELADRGSQCNR